MSKCDIGWSGGNGSCCCNCKFQLELSKHPWNKINKGNVTESSDMYACIAQHYIEEKYKGTIFEEKHGMCEFHEKR